VGDVVVVVNPYDATTTLVAHAAPPTRIVIVRRTQDHTAALNNTPALYPTEGVFPGVNGCNARGGPRCLIRLRDGAPHHRLDVSAHVPPTVASPPSPPPNNNRNLFATSSLLLNAPTPIVACPPPPPPSHTSLTAWMATRSSKRSAVGRTIAHPLHPCHLGSPAGGGGACPCAAPGILAPKADNVGTADIPQ
jgi:hypothetical protein